MPVKFKNKLSILLIFLLIAVIPAGCDNEVNNIELSTDYMGWEINTHQIYSYSFDNAHEDTFIQKVIGIESENGREIITVEETHQYEIDGETHESKSGKLYTREESLYKEIGYFHYDQNNEKQYFMHDDELTIISAPIKAGDIGFELYPDHFKIAIRKEEVTVPAGIFDAWYFEYDNKDINFHHDRNKVWFVPHVGVVKRESKMRFWIHNDEGGEWDDWGHQEVHKLLSYSFD